MATDPRVEAVRQALGGHLGITAPPAGQCCAEVVVAALDAYDGPKFSSVVHECCERPTEADLRERIGGELDHLWDVKNDEFGQRHTAYQEGYLDGIEHAARIARGQA